MTVTEVLQQVAAGFVARGVRGTVDPQNIQPPCVLVSTAGGRLDHLAGCATHTVVLHLIAPGTRAADALPVLDGLLAHADEVVEFSAWEPENYPVADAELPAYRIETEIDRPW